MIYLKNCAHALALAATCVTFLLAPTGYAAQVDDIDRLTEWPKLESKSKTTKEVSRLRKARTEEMASDAAAVLADMGAGTAPLLIKALAKEKDASARERIAGVLEQICGDAHTRLIAEEFEHDSVIVRAWALRQVASTPDQGVIERAEMAFERCAAIEDPDEAQRSEHLAAALCATSSGSTKALEALHETALSAWSSEGARIRRALESIRGPKASERFFTMARSGSDRKARIAALRLLAGCGEKERARDLLPMLDDSDNTIRVATINALRGIVDGEPPLEKLATFTAIEMAVEWKKRL